MFNIALVGCGGMAEWYRHVYTQIPGARLALVIDADPKVAKEAAEALNVPKYSTTFEDCLADGIDMVDISTPNHLHLPQGAAALRANKHVLMQKPLAANLADALQIWEASKEGTGTAGMFMNKLSSPISYQFKKIVESGVLGRPVSAYFRDAHRWGLAAKPGAWRNDLKKSGGAAFIQLSVHSVNFLCWLLDERVQSVTAISKKLVCPNVAGDDISHALCEMDSGLVATFESAYCAKGNAFSLYGTEGFISVANSHMVVNNHVCGPIHYTNGDSMCTVEYPGSPSGAYNAKNPHEQHVAFVKAVMAGRPAPVPLDIGVRDMRVVDAVYRSAAEGRRIDIVY